MHRIFGFVCIISKSFLIFWFHLHLLYQTYVNIRGPGICCWFSDRSNWSDWNFEAAVLWINPDIYTDQCGPIVIYHCITLLAIMQLCSHLFHFSCWLGHLSTILTKDGRPHTVYTFTPWEVFYSPQAESTMWEGPQLYASSEGNMNMKSLNCSSTYTWLTGRLITDTLTIQWNHHSLMLSHHYTHY